MSSVSIGSQVIWKVVVVEEALAVRLITLNLPTDLLSPWSVGQLLLLLLLIHTSTMLNDVKTHACTWHVSMEIATPAKAMPNNATTLLQCDLNGDRRQKLHVN